MATNIQPRPSTIATQPKPSTFVFAVGPSPALLTWTVLRLQHMGGGKVRRPIPSRLLGQHPTTLPGHEPHPGEKNVEHATTQGQGEGKTATHTLHRTR